MTLRKVATIPAHTRPALALARAHAARRIVSELLEDGDQITLEALALAVAERRMLERAAKGPPP